MSVSWSGAGDDQSGVYGYSIQWTTSPGTVPDAVVDTTASNATSDSLPDGDDWHFHVRTRDNAGNWNSGATHLGPFSIDTAPPTSSVTSLRRPGPDKSWFYVDWVASDATSGLDTLALGHGAHEFALAAGDRAGYAAAQRVVFTVTTTIQDLTALKHRLYNEGGIHGPGAAGVVHSLDAKLEAAQGALERGQVPTAIDVLNGFIGEVQAQEGQHVTPQGAALLVEGAQYVIAGLQEE